MTNAGKPFSLSISETAAKIKSGELTSVELVSSCLERIDALEENIQAWALVDRERALEAAQSLDRELQQGKRRGPLHGIPVGIKDIFYTAGLRTEAGSRTWLGFVPSYDATSVARLKEAGAIVLGKTHTTEFANFDPAPTRNPWNTRHTPGGSSSGSGAAVAAGMCHAALGSQTMGSVLRPAAYNGIVGFKPHHGRISAYGVVPVSWNLDHVGVLSRTVEDAALVFQAIAGYDPCDLNSLTEAVPDCLSNLQGQKAPRLGLVREYFYDHADEEMRTHTDNVAESLRHAGAEVKEVGLPSSFPNIHSNGRTIMVVELAAYHKEMFARNKDGYREGIRKLIEEGFATSVTDYARALQTRLQHYADVQTMFGGLDVLITPGAPGAAPEGLKSTGSPVMQAPWTVVGMPTINLPIGLSKTGLPLGTQLVGHPRTEDRLLATARWCERVLDMHMRPSLG